MRTFFKDLLEYTFTFNDKVIDSLILLKDTPEKSVKLINHTVNAQEIWNARIENISIASGVWDIRNMEELKAANKVNYKKSLDIVDIKNFNDKIKYTNTKGQTFENTIGEMLFHLINHSTYHRGQIASDCKLNGIEPLVTDYIFYKRTEI
jgi:uncharacterized damage-inducible protein DinB